MSEVTLIPTPCGERMTNRLGGYVWSCGEVCPNGVDRFLCRRCEPLGARLSSAGYDLCEFASGNEASYLAWNLTLAALLQAAEYRGFMNGMCCAESGDVARYVTWQEAFYKYGKN